MEIKELTVTQIGVQLLAKDQDLVVVEEEGDSNLLLSSQDRSV